jgi:hypothetical protein
VTYPSISCRAMSLMWSEQDLKVLDDKLIDVIQATTICGASANYVRRDMTREEKVTDFSKNGCALLMF